MCGRSRCALSPERVEQAAGVQHDRWVDRERYRPSYNVSPGAWTPILRLDEQNQPQLQTMRWGLVPSFTKPGDKPDFYRMFNARSESVAEKPVFSRLLKRQRCVVLLEGFYEWKTDAGGKKQPYYCNFGEGKVMKMAGLFDTWSGGSEGPLTTYTILTTDVAPRLSWLHNRMPVILPHDEAVAAWLGSSEKCTAEAHEAHVDAAAHHEEDGGLKAVIKGEEGSKLEVKAEGHGVAGLSDQSHTAAPISVQDLDKLCQPYNGELLSWHPVTPEMSKPSYNSPDASQDVRKKKGSISTFFKAGGSKPAKPMAATGAIPASDDKAAAAAGGDPKKATAASKAATSSSKEKVKQSGLQTATGGAQQQKGADKGSISSFLKPVVSSPRAEKHDRSTGVSIDKVRNSDEQVGPSKEDNEVTQQVAKDGKKRAAEVEGVQKDVKRGRTST